MFLQALGPQCIWGVTFDNWHLLMTQQTWCRKCKKMTEAYCPFGESILLSHLNFSKCLYNGYLNDKAILWLYWQIPSSTSWCALALFNIACKLKQKGNKTRRIVILPLSGYGASKFLHLCGVDSLKCEIHKFRLMLLPKTWSHTLRSKRPKQIQRTYLDLAF